MAVKRELLVVMKGAPDDLLKSLDRAKSAFKRLGADIEAAGKTMTAALTVPIVGLGAGIIKMAGEFERGMNAVKAITGATGTEFTRLRDLAKELGATTQFSATQAAEGMKFLAMAGFNTNQIIAAMPGLLNLAAAGQLDLARAADIVSNILSAFGENADQAGRASDLLATAAARTNTSVEQIGAAMSFAAPVAKAFGLTMEETAAFIGVYSDAGVQADRAGVALRASLVSLADPSQKAATALAELGVNTRDANGQMRPFGDIIKDLAKNGMTAEQAIAIFGGKMASAGLIAADATPKLGQLAEEFRVMEGNAGRMAATMQEGAIGAMTRLRSAIEALAIAVGDSGLLEFFTAIVERLAAFVRNLAQTNPELLKWATIIAGAAAALGPMVWALGAFVSSLSSLAGLLAGTSASAKAFGAALAGGQSIVAGLGVAIPGVTTALAALKGALALLAGAAGPIALVVAGLAALVVAYKTFSKEIDEGLNGIRLYASLFAGWGDAVAKAAKAAASDAVGAVKSITAEILNGLKPIADYVAAWAKSSAILTELRSQFDALWPAIARVTLALATGGMNEALRTMEAAFGRVRAAGKQYEEQQDAIGRVARAASNNIALMADEMLATAVTAGRATTATSNFGGAVTNTGAAVADIGGKVSQAGSEIQRFAFDAAAGMNRLNSQQAAWRSEWDATVASIRGVPPSLANLRAAIERYTAAVPDAIAKTTALIQSFDPLNTTLRFAGSEMMAWEERLKSAGITSKQVAEDGMAKLAEKLALAQEGYRNGTVDLQELNRVTGEYNQALGITASRQSDLAKLGQQVSTILTDLSRSIADSILGAKSLGDAFVNAAKAIAQAILRTIVEGAMDVLLDSIKNNTTALSGLIAKFKELFGLSSKAVGGGVPGAGGGKGGTPGVPGSGGGLLDALGAIGSIITAIASVFQVFQLRRIEQDIARIEVTSREIFAETFNRRADAWAQHEGILGKWDMAIDALWSMGEKLDQLLKEGLKAAVTLSTPANMLLFAIALPPEFKQALDDQLVELQAINANTVGVTDIAAESLGVLEAIAETLEGLVQTLGGIPTAAPLTGAMTINVQANNPAQFVAGLRRELERTGAARSGSVPLGVG